MHSQTGPTIGHSSGWKWDFLCLLRLCDSECRSQSVYPRLSAHRRTGRPPVRRHRTHDGSDVPQRLLWFMGRDSSTSYVSYRTVLFIARGGEKQIQYPYLNVRERYLHISWDMEMRGCALPLGAAAVRVHVYLSIWLAVSPTVYLCDNVFITKTCVHHYNPQCATIICEILRLEDMKPNHSRPDQPIISVIDRICPEVETLLRVPIYHNTHACISGLLIYYDMKLAQKCSPNHIIYMFHLWFLSVLFSKQYSLFQQLSTFVGSQSGIFQCPAVAGFVLKPDWCF